MGNKTSSLGIFLIIIIAEAGRNESLTETIMGMRQISTFSYSFRKLPEKFFFSSLALNGSLALREVERKEN